jgi:hypothetical protein
MHLKLGDLRRGGVSLLQWIAIQKTNIGALSVGDRDPYIASRCKSMRRTSIALLVSDLRGVLRHLHRTKQVQVELSKVLRGPPLYALESIPSIMHPEDIKRTRSSEERSNATRSSRLRDLDVVRDLWLAFRRGAESVVVGHRLASRTLANPALPNRCALGPAAGTWRGKRAGELLAQWAAGHGRARGVARQERATRVTTHQSG